MLHHSNRTAAPRPAPRAAGRFAPGTAPTRTARSRTAPTRTARSRTVPSRANRLTGLLVAAVAVGAHALLAGTAHAATPAPVGTPPVAVISVPERVYAGIPVTLSGARSTSSSGSISEWSWDLGGDGSYERSSLSDPNVSKAFPLGRHTVGLRVRGENGLVASRTTSFTAVKPPAASVKPAAPTSVASDANGTAVKVTWTAPLGAAPLTYRVVTTAADSADPAVIHVPAGGTESFTFTDLVPDTYTFQVAAVNAAGIGPSASTEATVRAKGAASPSTSTEPTPGASGAGDPNTGASAPIDPATPAADASGSDDRDLLAIGLIGGGVLLLVIAGTTAVIGARRRTA